MKSWTVSELNNVVTALKPLIGLRLQEVQTSVQDVVLGFYSPQGMLWLWIDLNAISPCLLPWSELPLRPLPAKTPLQLFLRAHFVDRVLREIRVSKEFGRVIHLHFGSPTEAYPPRLELRLFPHGRNLLASASGQAGSKHGSKQIAWQKPTELSGPMPEQTRRETLPRTLEQLREEWLAQKGKSKSVGKKSTDVRSRLQNDLDKKRKALLKVGEELVRKQDLPWKAVGTWLKQNQTVEVPKEWEPFVDKRRKLAWNIEQCFTKAREGSGKILGTEKRRLQLQNEIAALEVKLAGPLREPPPTKAKPSLEKMDAQGRTLRLGDELMVVTGKSAIDNLKILRKARAWDLWFHLRDFPSSHAVLFRGKNVNIGDKIIFEVAAWFVKNHLGGQVAQHAGEKFDIVIAECRHVHPVKGDKVGRVTYHEERVLTYKVPQRLDP